MLSSAIPSPDSTIRVRRISAPMAKRARGNRPGRRRPMQRPGPRPVTPNRLPGPTERSSDAGPADEMISEQSDAFPARSQDAPRMRARPSGTFVASAAQEYAYVRSDLRRIALIGGSLFGVLLVLFVLIEAMHPFGG